MNSMSPTVRESDPIKNYFEKGRKCSAEERAAKVEAVKKEVEELAKKVIRNLKDGRAEIKASEFQLPVKREAEWVKDRLLQEGYDCSFEASYASELAIPYEVCVFNCEKKPSEIVIEEKKES